MNQKSKVTLKEINEIGDLKLSENYSVFVPYIPWYISTWEQIKLFFGIVPELDFKIYPEDEHESIRETKDSNLSST